MVADVIKFPGKFKPAPPTLEELEAANLEQIEECIDRSIKSFIIDTLHNVPNVDPEYFNTGDMVTQKIIGLVRESMRATIFRLQDKHHDLQDIAEDIIAFDSDVREQIIEDDE